MLKGLFQSKEDRLRVKIEELLAEGMKLMSDKFYNGAMIEFDKAMEKYTEKTMIRLQASRTMRGQLIQLKDMLYQFHNKNRSYIQKNHHLRFLK